MNDVYYAIEPYTGDIICHYGVKGMLWGFAKGVANGARQAIGKLDPQSGQYVYDTAKYIGNRLRSGQFGSRTMQNAKNIANYVGDRIRTGQFGSRTIQNTKNRVNKAIDDTKHTINKTYDDFREGNIANNAGMLVNKVGNKLRKNDNKFIRNLGEGINKNIARGLYNISDNQLKDYYKDIQNFAPIYNKKINEGRRKRKDSISRNRNLDRMRMNTPY